MKSDRISKTLSFFFKLLQIIFAADFGFIKYNSRKHRLIVKLLGAAYCICLNCLCVLLLFYHDMTNELRYWHSKYLFENMLYNIILLLTPQHKSFCYFLEKLKSIDTQLCVNSCNNIDFKIIFCCIICFLSKFLISAIYCQKNEECIMTLWFQMLYFVPFLALDFPFIVMLFMFYAAKYRLVALQKCIEDEKFNPKKLQHIYKSLADFTESTKSSFNILVAIALFLNMPSFMFLIYKIIKEIKMDTKEPLDYLMQSVSVASTAIVIFAPSVSASSLSSQAEKIKITLHNMLLEERGQNGLQDIQRFIDYEEARPFKFHIMNIFPMDVTLPIMMLNICVTYLIIILQLTHLY